MSGRTKAEGGTVQVGVLGTDAGGALVVRRVVLRVVSGPNRGLETLLEGGTLIVGSHPDADLVLHDPTVSRYHAELVLLGEGVRVRDLGSTNGTFIGTSRVESAIVTPVAEVRFGKSRIEILPADVPAPDVPSERTRFGRLVGASPLMRRLFGVLERVAPTDVPVVLEGEPGVGKSEAARAVHDASPRASGPFTVVDLGGAVPPGAVTHAFEASTGGTVVLDRVDETPSAVAAELVAALDRHERGELDVRPIATSRTDLRSRVEAGSLRRDLFFHLAAVRAIVPPLRERLEDLPRLVHDIAEGLGYRGMVLTAAEITPVVGQDFPGNVRELRRLIEQTLFIGRGSSPPGGEESFPGVDAALSTLPFKDAKERLVEAFERQYVAQLLARHSGNISRAATEAGIDRNHLARLAKKHGIR